MVERKPTSGGSRMLLEVPSLGRRHPGPKAPEQGSFLLSSLRLASTVRARWRPKFREERRNFPEKAESSDTERTC